MRQSCEVTILRGQDPRRVGSAPRPRALRPIQLAISTQEVAVLQVAPRRGPVAHMRPERRATVSRTRDPGGSRHDDGPARAGHEARADRSLGRRRNQLASACPVTPLVTAGCESMLQDVETASPIGAAQARRDGVADLPESSSRRASEPEVGPGRSGGGPLRGPSGCGSARGGCTSSRPSRCAR